MTTAFARIVLLLLALPGGLIALAAPADARILVCHGDWDPTNYTCKGCEWVVGSDPHSCLCNTVYYVQQDWCVPGLPVDPSVGGCPAEFDVGYAACRTVPSDDNGSVVLVVRPVPTVNGSPAVPGLVDAAKCTANGGPAALATANTADPSVSALPCLASVDAGTGCAQVACEPPTCIPENPAMSMCAPPRGVPACDNVCPVLRTLAGIAEGASGAACRAAGSGAGGVACMPVSWTAFWTCWAARDFEGDDHSFTGGCWDRS